eukprot:TRINITY_DN9743_c0_g2_i1.p1 TRINITY_DN9743_c0_g2~~TRINITY_DN9743_c0_g2_i1.p1  ORF type:complete len:656 (-),score=128.09 TRINITY_DN9743_c0_g2_i1:247-2214(-)
MPLQELIALSPSFEPQGNITNATVLTLKGKKLKELPECITQLSRLQALYMIDNKLSGLPSKFSNLSNLRVLNICHNKFSTLPSEISTLTNLKYLRIYANPISEIPGWITILSHLQELDVYDPDSLLSKVQVKRLPRGITQLPCWNDVNCCKRLQKITLYDDHDDFSKLAVSPTALPDRTTVSVKTEKAPQTSGSTKNHSMDENTFRAAIEQLEERKQPDSKSPPEPLEFEHNPRLASTTPTQNNPPLQSTTETTLPNSKTPGPANLVDMTRRYHSDTGIASNQTQSPPAPQGHQDRLSIDPRSLPTSRSEIPLDEMAILYELDYSKYNPIGQGGFGVIYRVDLPSNVVAIKMLKACADPGTVEYEALTSEARMMVSLVHPNIIRLYSYGSCGRNIIYVMEYADGGNLSHLLSDGPLPWELFWPFSIDIARGLLFLHTQTPPIEHRDLKPENILINHGIAKIADFGLSAARETISKATGFAGTLSYAPPEAFDAKTYGPASDVYTFGLVLWSMITGKTPYDKCTLAEVARLKLEGRLPEIPTSCPAKLKTLIRSCWNSDARSRPFAQQVELDLRQISKDPGAANDIQELSVREMNNTQLCAFLKGKVTDVFLALLKEYEFNGDDFLQFTDADLAGPPYNLGKPVRVPILKIIEKSK